MVGFNIDNFISSINANSVMRNNKFLVRIPTPNGFGAQKILNETGKYLELWCDSANLPSAMLGSESVRRYGYGHEEKRPTTIQVNDMNLTFISDGRAAIWTFFQQWIRLIYNYDMSSGLLKSNGVTTNMNAMDLSYKSDYAVDIELFVFTETGQQLLSVILREAYPMSLGDVQLNWSDTNNIAKIPVSFTFFDWYNTDTQYSAGGFNVTDPQRSGFNSVKTPQ
jgi:hypothetical protein